MHVESSRRPHVRRDGTEVVYERHLLRRSFRNAEGKPDKETLASLSALPAEAIAAIRAVLSGKTLVDVAEAFEITRSLPHGHVAAVHAMAQHLGFPALLGPAGRERDLALALIVSRVVRPKPKLSTLSWWGDTTLGPDLGVAGASPAEVYAAMDWLRGRQDAIEAELARRHLAEGGMAMFDLSSSWMEGTHCELAARGYSRDGKKGKTQIEYGLLTDAQARPVAVRVFPGNTADPTAFVEAVEVVRTKFGLTRLTMVGDRGMITSARIEAIQGTGLSWITCLRAPDIAALAADDGPLQMSLFDTTPTTPTNGSSPAATPPWPTCAPTNAKTSSPPPRPCWTKSSTESRPAPCPARTTSASPSAKLSTSTRWPNTSPSTSDRLGSPTNATKPASTPKPPSTASTSSAPTCQPMTSTPPARSSPTRTSPAWNATGATSKPTTSTYAPSTTTAPAESKPTYSSACSPS